MSHKSLQDSVCFELFRRKPTLDEMNDRAALLAGAGRVMLAGMGLIVIIIAWWNL